MATKKLGTDVTKAFARASRRLPMTIKKLAPATRTRRQAARTMWTASKLLEAYRDPREVLLEIVSTDTATLAERNGCTLLEALGERRLCAQAVLPYVAQKLPVQVDMRHTRAIHLNIVSDEQYQELVNVAQELGDDAQSISVRLVNGLGTESTTGETTEGETGVLPSVGSRSPGDDGSS